MIVELTQSWVLSDEHSASSYGQPVLVHRPTGDAFGPGDIVQPYPSWGRMLAKAAVLRMARIKGIVSNSLVATFMAFPG